MKKKNKLYTYIFLKQVEHQYQNQIKIIFKNLDKTHQYINNGNNIKFYHLNLSSTKNRNFKGNVITTIANI